MKGAKGLDSLEKMLIAGFQGEKKTPDSFRQVVREVLPPEAVSLWERWLVGSRAKRWKGMSFAAQKAYDSIGIFLQESDVDVEVIEAALNAIYSVIPYINSNSTSRRSAYDQEWDVIDQCKLCWRLAPAGKATFKRRPLCHHHQAGSAGYRRFHRVAKYFSAAKLEVGSSIKEFNSFCDELMARLPHVARCVSFKGCDISSPEDIIKVLLLDVPDPFQKIKREINDVILKDFFSMKWVLIHAEACLSILHLHAKPDRQDAYCR